MQAKSNRRKKYAKPIVLTAAVLCVILLSAVAPKLLLEWKDRNTTGQFTPLKREFATLNGESGQNNIGRVYRMASATYTPVATVTARSEIESILEQSILPLLLELEDAELLMGEITARVIQTVEQSDCTIEMYESDSDSLLFRNYMIETTGIRNNIELLIDIQANQVIMLNMMFSNPSPDMFPGFDHEAVFQKYVNWLGLDMVDDWEVVAQPSDAITFYRVFSQQYGLTANVEYVTDTDIGFYYSLSVAAT